MNITNVLPYIKSGKDEILFVVDNGVLRADGNFYVECQVNDLPNGCYIFRDIKEATEELQLKRMQDSISLEGGEFKLILRRTQGYVVKVNPEGAILKAQLDFSSLKDLLKYGLTSTVQIHHDRVTQQDASIWVNVQKKSFAQIDINVNLCKLLLRVGKGHHSYSVTSNQLTLYFDNGFIVIPLARKVNPVLLPDTTVLKEYNMKLPKINMPKDIDVKVFVNEDSTVSLLYNGISYKGFTGQKQEDNFTIRGMIYNTLLKSGDDVVFKVKRYKNFIRLSHEATVIVVSVL